MEISSIVIRNPFNYCFMHLVYHSEMLTACLCFKLQYKGKYLPWAKCSSKELKQLNGFESAIF